ncbi:MAG: hypothetical protein ABH874_08395 [Methanobacteriota archaeon]
MSTTLKDLLTEIRLMREEIREIKDILVPEIKPDEEDIKAIERGRQEYKKGEYVRLSELKNVI